MFCLYGRLSSKTSPLAHATSLTKPRVLFPLLQSGWLSDLLWTTECSTEYTEPLLDLGLWKLGSSAFILLGSGCHVSRVELLNEDGPQRQRKTQAGHICSSHPDETWNTWVKPSRTFEIQDEQVAQTTTRSRTAKVSPANPQKHEK